MRESVLKKIEIEEAKDGLIILEAVYGKLGEPNLLKARVLSPAAIIQMISDIKSMLRLSHEPKEYDQIIDVTVAVQAMVSNSQLVIQKSDSKAGLIGFYDPCIGEKKHLRVTYRFKGKTHQVQVSDKEILVAPLEIHLV